MECDESRLADGCANASRWRLVGKQKGAAAVDSAKIARLLKLIWEYFFEANLQLVEHRFQLAQSEMMFSAFQAVERGMG